MREAKKLFQTDYGSNWLDKIVITTVGQVDVNRLNVMINIDGNNTTVQVVHTEGKVNSNKKWQLESDDYTVLLPEIKTLLKDVSLDAYNASTESTVADNKQASIDSDKSNSDTNTSQATEPAISQGEYTWFKTYDSSFNPSLDSGLSYSYEAKDVVQTTNRDYLIVSVSYGPAGDDSETIAITKLNEKGELIYLNKVLMKTNTTTGCKFTIRKQRINHLDTELSRNIT